MAGLAPPDKSYFPKTTSVRAFFKGALIKKIVIRFAVCCKIAGNFREIVR